ncbi:MAG: ATP-binding cassette domain-containing protein [Fusobacteriaceae bacterium]|nr:ATP-binding cassette domain-containing protein [Fusobacteriaceae bacterium]MBU9918657.1 ATP-binding cassette domain-containing protein [Fusobacteriaceae bacterium]
MFKINNVNKNYGFQKVLSEINLEIPQNKLTCIIGPNGAGKSTLLNAISRLIKVDKGDILINSKNLKDWDKKELSKTLSIMKQLNNINVRLTIADLVAFGRYPYSEDRLTENDYQKINEALEYTGLSSIKDKYIDELSGGQKQRTYIAMTLAQDTEYILLDEPLNNLDIKHILEVMHLLKKLVEEQNKTIILVVHDINIASTFADYIVAMKNGEIIESGLTEDIINNEILYKIYEINFQIENFKNKNFCLYY